MCLFQSDSGICTCEVAFVQNEQALSSPVMCTARSDSIVVLIRPFFFNRVLDASITVRNAALGNAVQTTIS